VKHSSCQGRLRVAVRSSSYGGKHLDSVVDMIRGWFYQDWLEVEGVIDESSEWNFEITVGGVLLHSRNTLGHSFFYDDWSQQNLVWRAISDISHGSMRMAEKGA